MTTKNVNDVNQKSSYYTLYNNDGNLLVKEYVKLEEPAYPNVLISVKDFKDFVDTNNGSFMQSDVASIMKELQMDNKIITIESYDNIKKDGDKYNKLNECINYINSNEDYKDSIILITSYVSKYEYPNTKYYLYEEDKVPEKELLPVVDVLEEADKNLTALGFENINNLVGYEYKNAYIYNNEPAKKIIEYVKNNYERSLV